MNKEQDSDRERPYDGGEEEMVPAEQELIGWTHFVERMSTRAIATITQPQAMPHDQPADLIAHRDHHRFGDLHATARVIQSERTTIGQSIGWSGR